MILNMPVTGLRNTVLVAFVGGLLAINEPTDGQSPGALRFEAYPMRHAQAADIENKVQDVLAGLGESSEVVCDRRANRVLVRGSAKAQQMARRAIESLDRPMATEQSVEPLLKTYACPGGNPQDWANRIKEKIAADAKARITADARTRQILVLAPPAVQEQVAAILQQAPAAPARRSVPAKPAAQSMARTAERGTQIVSLRNLTAKAFETALANLCARQLPVATERGGQVARYSLEARRGDSVSLVVDRPAKRVALEGNKALVEGWARIIAAIDTPSESLDSSTRIVPLRNAETEAVQKALAAFRPTTAPQNDSNSQPPVPRRAAAPQGSQLPQLAGQPGAGEPPPPAPPAGQQAPSANDSTPGTRPVGPVKIEFLEGLDVIVIRGHPRDVERVTQIINDIERLSAETEPTIVIFPLRHVGSDALATLIRQLYDQALSQRQGKVSITPLIKPNALLLIGREDSVKTVIDLIQRLDQPVSPTTQFRFYALRHTSASSAQSTIQEFFANRAGMGVKVLVTADLRTNSIIVQASPRDVLEVEALVKRIDVATSAAENELRIFPLQNSLADDLAPILQSAISGQPSSTRSRSTATQGGGGAGPGGGGAGGQFGSGGGQLGGGAGGGGSGGGGAQATAAAQQTSQSGSRDRTAMLRFVTVDADGGRGLKSGILTDVHITADPRANSLIISAPSESMDLLAALVKQLDQIPSTESQIKVFTVVNGDALTLVQMLETLFGRRTTAAQGAGQGGGIAAAIGGIIANSVSGDSGLVALRLSVDQRTNSIVASGSASDLNIVEAILFRLDDSDIRQRKSIVYRLKNAPALDVATSLNEFLRTERQVQQISPGSLSPFEQIEREVVIVPEPVSNSLIVSATPRFFEEIKKVVEQLDARPPMVMIQVLIAEVGLNNVDEFGIELGLQDSVLFDRSLLGNLVTTTTTTTFGNPPTTTQNQTVQAATNSPGFDFNNLPLGNSGSNKALDNSKDVGAQGLSHFGVGRINNELGFGGLVLSASSESVSMLLRALSESRRLDVLSRPQIMSLDNQPAYIQVGQRVPRVTGTTVNTVGNINNTVTLEPVGLILGVTPRISPDGLVVMEIDAEKSEVGPESEGIPISISNNGQAIRSPRINLELAQTTVSAMSGQTVVLGGLITKSHLQVHRRVPYLSAVPVLGNLFRYDNDTVKRTELLIIMTPRVVRSEAEADLIKQTEAARMNWCLADAIKMHGASGLRGRGDEWTDTETIVIYPDNPDGTPGSVEDLPAPKADAKKPAGQSKEPADKPEPPVLLPKAAKPTPAEPLKLDDARGSDSAQFRPVAGPNAVWQAAFQGPAPAGPTAAPNNFRGLAAPAVGTVR